MVTAEKKGTLKYLEYLKVKKAKSGNLKIGDGDGYMSEVIWNILQFWR